MPQVPSKLLAITLRCLTGRTRRKVQASGGGEGIKSGAVTLIQRFGGSLNLNVHFHMLILEGGYRGSGAGLEFVRCPAPSSEEVGKLLKSLSTGILRWLVRQGYYEGDGLSQAFPGNQDGVLASCQAASIQYRIALGARAGQRVPRLGAMKSCLYEEAEFSSPRCASLGGFSLHANTACEAWEGEKLERLCRYVARPALAIGRLTRRSDGMLVYQLKQANRDGTKYLLFSPEELMEKLAALVPRPRVHLVDFWPGQQKKEPGAGEGCV